MDGANFFYPSFVQELSKKMTNIQEKLPTLTKSMTEKQANKIFEKHNPADDVVRCPYGRAKMRKPLDLYAKAAVNLYGIIKRDEFVDIFNAGRVMSSNQVRENMHGKYKT